MNDPALLHLMHLVSPALPVGAYAYSQGLESAVDHGWVNDLDSAEQWMRATLSTNLAYLDAPVFLRLYAAWNCVGDDTKKLSDVKKWNQFLQASRESSELLLEDIQMGEALLRLLRDLKMPHALDWALEKNTSYATVFALAASHWKIDANQALQGFLWSWLENQVAAAIKLIPLGQTQGQHLLVNIISDIGKVALTAEKLQDDNLAWSLPRLAMASMQHEAQYSRLFRS